MDDNTRWADIPGFPGYQASDAGQIRHISPMKGRVKILGQGTNPSGHKTVQMKDSEWKSHKRYVHRLVLEAFVGPGGKLFGCHYDDNPGNNRLDNLRWDTPAGNGKDLARNTRRATHKHLALVKTRATWSPDRVADTETRNALAQELAALEKRRHELLDNIEAIDEKYKS